MMPRLCRRIATAAALTLALSLPAGAEVRDADQPRLEAFDAMIGDGARPACVLDIGCGTAVLAMAAAKTLEARVIASDLDERGVDTSNLRGFAHCQELFDSYFQFYLPAREGRSVEPELIELVRLKIARHNDCFT